MDLVMDLGMALGMVVCTVVSRAVGIVAGKDLEMVLSMATDFLVRGNRRLTRYGRWALVALLPVLSGGCVWYQDLDMSHGQREHRIGKYSVRKQDPHLNRFYQLQQRIDQLESQLERGKIRSSEPHAGIHPPAQQVNQPVNTAIEAIKHKTNQAIEAIDAMILQFSDASNSDVRDEIEALAEQTPAVHQGAISGMLQRSASGEVIGSSSDGNRYNYSVVYVYPETTPWLDM